MKKDSKVPSMPERIKGMITTPLVQPTPLLVNNLYELHKAEMSELLEDVELLIDPAKAAAFRSLKESYLT